jgi:hypothetical protein
MSDGEADGTEGVTSSDTPRSGGRHKVILERGWKKRALIHDLARMESTTIELGERYGVHHSTVSNFKTRHMDEIAAVARDIDNEMSGLWVAQKKNRVAELQQNVEDIIAELEAVEITHGDRIAFMAEKRATLKQVAEELGQLLNRQSVTLSGEVAYRYLTGNVNDEDLV